MSQRPSREITQMKKMTEEDRILLFERRPFKLEESLINYTEEEKKNLYFELASVAKDLQPSLLPKQSLKSELVAFYQDLRIRSKKEEFKILFNGKDGLDRLERILNVMKESTEGMEENDELVDFPQELAQGFQNAFISFKDPWISEVLNDETEDSATYLALFKAIGGQVGKEKIEKVGMEE